MKNGKVLMSLLLESLDPGTRDAVKSKVCRKMTEPQCPAEWAPRNRGTAASVSGV